jgi:2-amino-4-hydroxy-6-hydroxymethyldihydropteridine diphosphokinase
VKAAIGLGSSLGDRFAWIELALRKLDATAGIRVLRVSRLVRTPPMKGGSARGWFLNAVCLIETELSPPDLLRACAALEESAGRRRKSHWGDRTLDLDVLLVDGVVRTDPWLTLPHPGIARRPFVLGPLLEVWPGATHPGTGVPYAELPQGSGPVPVPVGILARRCEAV